MVIKADGWMDISVALRFIICFIKQISQTAEQFFFIKNIYSKSFNFLFHKKEMSQNSREGFKTVDEALAIECLV